jgi:hypothetical protein
MRPAIRPFKVEFKTRHSKSSAPPPRPSDGAGKDPAIPSFLDVGIFTAGLGSHADGYDAAMKAADALFARSVPAAPTLETISPPNTPVGRVLPSLIENNDVLAVRSRDADAKPRRSRVAKQAKAASFVRPKQPTIQQEGAVAPASLKQAAIEIAPETPIAAASERERRSVQKRRLLDAELKIGEKWKRRQCRAAR